MGIIESDFFEIITIIFLIAKIMGKFEYSWFWVFLPVIFIMLIKSFNLYIANKKNK